MAEIKPFKGILYNLKKVVNMETVVAPPYDVIPGNLQEELYLKSDYNVVRLILGKIYDTDNDKNSRYTRAAECLNDWLKSEVLQQSKTKCLYFYSQEYSSYGEKKNRIGFIARVKLEEIGKGSIFPHEFTLSKPKADRLNLTRACKTNFSQVFGLFPDPEKTIDSLVEKSAYGQGVIKTTDPEGVVHTFGSITDKNTIDQIRSAMKEKPIYIADGHHRYETALAYRDEIRESQNKESTDNPHDYVMMYLTNMNSEGTSIFPIHRLLFNLDSFQLDKTVKSLESYFAVEKFSFDNSAEKGKAREQLFQQMKSKGEDNFAFGLYSGEQTFYLFLLKDNPLRLDSSKPKDYYELDAFILHSLVIEKVIGINKEAIKNQENIAYKKDEKEAIEMVDSGKYQLALFLNPTRMEQIKNIAGAGERMPQKSTFFYPKLLSGLVFNPLANED